MTKGNATELLVGLDIGTSKVVCLIGQRRSAESDIEIIGMGQYPSKGLKKGVVVNIEATVQAVERAVEQAELMAGCQVHSVFTSVAGSHIKGVNSHGIVAIRESEVTQPDIDRVMDAAQAVAIPADRKVLHVLPQEFLVDEQEGIRDPLGMSGVRLEAKVHLVTCAANAGLNIEKCVRQCGLDVAHIILDQIASGCAILTEDEKELGVCLLDIGGGTTDIAVFAGGAVRHTTVIPIAGDQVTNDLAMALRTPTECAEEIKIHSGCALKTMTVADELVEVPGVGDRPAKTLLRQALAEVIGPRFEELFYLVLSELKRKGFEDLLAAGIALTGGSAKMEGVVELAEEVFKMPVRLCYPQAVTGPLEVIRNPVYATAVGLLLYGQEKRADFRSDRERINHFRSMLQRVQSWVKGRL